MNGATWATRAPRRARAVWTVLVAVLLSLGLAACTEEPEEAEEAEIAVSGSFGSVPTVTFDAPLPLEDQSVETLIEGEGRELVEGGPVLLSLTAYEGDTGQLVEDQEAGAVRSFTLTPEGITEDLFDVLVGQREGTRLLLQQPVEENGEQHMLVLVLDLRHTQAQGEEMEPPEGAPEVRADSRGVPSVEIPDGDPPRELVVAPLIRGEGPQVGPGQQVMIQSVIVSWETGELEGSTWESGEPGPVDLGEDPEDVPNEGLRQGLLDQPVGSRVLLVIPPALGDGEQTLVAVVDILTASGGDSETVISTEPPPVPGQEEDGEASDQDAEEPG